MTKILLLGKHGQVGRELALALGEMEVTAPDRTELDLADPDTIRRSLRALDPDIVINAAAFTDVDEAQNNPAQAMQINRDAPAAIARELQASRGVLIHYSTDYVFDGHQSSQYKENDVPAPINIYGQSKLEGEQAIIGTGGAYLILRTSWVYDAGNNFCRTVWRLARQ
jgi:dTDP-4-dehydrorhamnose reductase